MLTIVLFALLMMAARMSAHSAELFVASYYWEDRYTATGARFDPNKMAVAHKTLPFGTRLTLRHGHRSAVVVVNDRGPYIRGRTFDLTPAVKKALWCGSLCRVKVEPWPPLPKPSPLPKDYFDATGDTVTANASPY